MLFESKKWRVKIKFWFFWWLALKTVLKMTAKNFNCEIVARMRSHFCHNFTIEIFSWCALSDTRSIIEEALATCVTKTHVLHRISQNQSEFSCDLSSRTQNYHCSFTPICWMPTTVSSVTGRDTAPSHSQPLPPLNALAHEVSPIQPSHLPSIKTAIFFNMFDKLGGCVIPVQHSFLGYFFSGQVNVILN